MKKQKLKDLRCWDFMYYIGDIINLDGDGWVTEEEAIEILKEVNSQYFLIFIIKLNDFINWIIN